MRFKNIQEVKQHFDSTKPIRGTNIVPLGERRRKWEEIRDYSTSTTLHYRLFCEGEWFVEWEHDMTNDTTLARVRNHGGHMGLKFLTRYTPMGLHFEYGQSGKHYIHTHKGEGMFKSHYLPVTWRYTEDQPTLVYEKLGDKWKLIGDKYFHTRKRVKKQEKAPYRKAIQDLFDDFMVIAPLLVLGSERQSWSERRETERKHMEAIRGTSDSYDYRDDWRMYRGIMLYRTSENRADMVGIMLYDMEINDLHSLHNASMVNIRSRFNNWINKNCDFTEDYTPPPRREEQ
tara:strand:- start:3013 stop:3873 length:861 start_codon:yes stop_codon:yes gene_type:complete